MVYDQSGILGVIRDMVIYMLTILGICEVGGCLSNEGSCMSRQTLDLDFGLISVRRLEVGSLEIFLEMVLCYGN